MKKFISIVSLVSLISLSAMADSQVYTITSGFCSNIISGSVKVSKVIVGSGTTSAANITAYDAPSTVLIYTNGSYSTITQYGTNVITSYTDFFGKSTLLTNFSLVTATNTYTGATNNYTQRFNVAPGTNAQTVMDNVSFYFVNGLTLTNSGTGTATVTVNVQR